MQQKVKGLVVREKEQGEMDKLVYVLTDTLGMIVVRAHGVRKISSGNAKSAQTFAYSELVLDERNGFYSIRESTLIRNFYHLREDVVHYALACYLCELSSFVDVGGEEGNEILRLLLNALYALENHISEPLVIKAGFEFRLAALIGFAPDLSECPICGKAADEIPDRVFDLTDGYLFCASCENPADGFTHRRSVSEPVYHALKHILTSPLNKVYLFQISPKSLMELSEIAELFILLRMERKIPTLDFFKKTIDLPNGE